MGREIKALEPGILAARYVAALQQSGGHAYDAIKLARLNYPSTPQIAQALERKGAIDPGGTGADTSNSTWANPLAQYGISQDSLEMVSSQTVLGR